MSRTAEDVETYLLQLDRRFELDNGTFLLSSGPSVPPIAIRVAPPIVAVRVLIGATPTDDLMLKVFPGEDIRVFRPKPVALVCRCSHASISTMLVSLGRKELESLVRERGEVEVTCEFCGKSYRYSVVEMQKLFEATEAKAGAATRH